MTGKPPPTLTKLVINWDDVRRVEHFAGEGGAVTVVVTWQDSTSSAYELGPESLNFFDHLIDNWVVWRKNGIAVLGFNHAEKTS